MEEHGSQAFLINTGWYRGKYGVGQRLPLQENRRAIDAIFSGAVDKAEFETLPLFNLQMPKSLPGVSLETLNPRNSWSNKDEYDQTSKKLAQMFIDNFKKFSNTDKGKALIKFGPQL